MLPYSIWKRPFGAVDGAHKTRISPGVCRKSFFLHPVVDVDKIGDDEATVIRRNVVSSCPAPTETHLGVEGLWSCTPLSTGEEPRGGWVGTYGLAQKQQNIKKKK